MRALIAAALAVLAGAAAAQPLPPRPTPTALADPGGAAWPIAVADPFDAVEGPGDAMTAIAAVDRERVVVLRVDLEGNPAWRTEIPLAGGIAGRDGPPRLVALRGGELLVVADGAVHRLDRAGAIAWRADAAALGLNRIDSAGEAGAGLAIGGSGSRTPACNRAPERCEDLRAMVVSPSPGDRVAWQYRYDTSVPPARGHSALDMQVLGRFGRTGALALALPAPDATHGQARLLWLDDRGRLARNAPVEIPRAGAAFERDVIAQRRSDGTLVVSSLATTDAAATIHVQTLGTDGRRRGERAVRLPTRFADGTACTLPAGAREVGAGFVLQRLACRTGNAPEQPAFVVVRFEAPSGEARLLWLDDGERPLRLSDDGRVILALAGGRIVRLAMPSEAP